MKEILSEDSLKKLEDAVTEVEKSTSAEVVIAIARFSEHYRDIPLLAGFVLSMVSLLVMLIVPWIIHHIFVMPVVLLSFAAGYFISIRCEPVIRFFTSEKRREIQVDRGAKLAFYEEHVSATKDRTGILFYISIFEQKVEILTDLGIDGKISKDRWNTISSELTEALKGKNSVEQFAESLIKSADILAKSFPPDEHNVDEIPNRPRIIN